MMSHEHEQQLEFFDVINRPALPARRHMFAPVRFHIRADQAMMSATAGLIGLAVIFACGVERGKQLVRSERTLLARQPVELPELPAAATASPARRMEPRASLPQSEPVKAAHAVPLKTATDSVDVKKTPPSKSSASKKKSEVEQASAAGKSRYAIQLVAFSKPRLAKKELDRLQATGERAFLVMRQGRTVVCAGPFPSKTHAAEKLTNLKPKYQDCFIKTL